MENVMSFLVPAYFLHGAVGMGILSWWFMTRKNKTLNTFGKGLLGYSLGMLAWAFLVILRPDNLVPLILVGVVPFVLAHFAYAKVAYKDFSEDKKRSMIALITVGVAAILVVRTFIFPSDPYYSAQGSFFFGLHPVAIALYIAVISMSLLPAIRIVVEEIKDKTTKTVMNIGLTTIFVNIILQISVTYDTLLIINGVVLSVALLATWLTALKARAVLK